LLALRNKQTLGGHITGEIQKQGLRDQLPLSTHLRM
jgi:hypothetical protein